MIRILVVDDSAFMRRAISQMLSSDPDLDVIDTARDGREGLEKTKSLKPDVVTMDIEMPDMDGLTSLRRIMKECPTPVIMCSSLSTEGSHAALKALSLGAFDCIAKDSSQISLKVLNLENDLRGKVKAAARNKSRIRRAASLSSSSASSAATANVTEAIDALRGHRTNMIVIGSSTGGPPVVEKILAGIPEGFRIPIVIAQHMPVLFTRSLAERLNEHCAIPVIHAEHRMPIRNGNVYILPGETHGRISAGSGLKLFFDIGPEPRSELYRPSVNELMRSTAKVIGGHAVGFILTGMGADGRDGAKELVEAGGKLFAQSEETCVVYGMPKAVTEAGITEAALRPDDFVSIIKMLGQPKVGVKR